MAQTRYDDAREGLRFFSTALLSLILLLAAPTWAASSDKEEGLIHCPELDLHFDEEERLQEKRRDSNADCQVDQVVEYEEAQAVRAREDRDHDGREDA